MLVESGANAFAKSYAERVVSQATTTEAASRAVFAALPDRFERNAGQDLYKHLGGDATAQAAAVGKRAAQDAKLERGVESPLHRVEDRAGRESGPLLAKAFEQSARALAAGDYATAASVLEAALAHVKTPAQGLALARLAGTAASRVPVGPLAKLRSVLGMGGDAAIARRLSQVSQGAARKVERAELTPNQALRLAKLAPPEGGGVSHPLNNQLLSLEAARASDPGLNFDARLRAIAEAALPLGDKRTAIEALNGPRPTSFDEAFVQASDGLKLLQAHDRLPAFGGKVGEVYGKIERKFFKGARPVKFVDTTLGEKLVGKVETPAQAVAAVKLLGSADAGWDVIHVGETMLDAPPVNRTCEEMLEVARWTTAVFTGRGEGLVDHAFNTIYGISRVETVHGLYGAAYILAKDPAQQQAVVAAARRQGVPAALFEGKAPADATQVLGWFKPHAPYSALPGKAVLEKFTVQTASLKAMGTRA